VVLLEQREVAGAEEELGSPAGELIQGGSLLGDDRRISEDHARDFWPQANPRRSCCCGGEQRPHVLVVRLVGAVAGPEAELLEELDDVEKLV
jgi:hypothetical protein